MRSLLLLSLFCCTSLLPAQEYFQQEVDYDISVSLNDRTHELLGQLTLGYTNNSPDQLTRIPFHVWPNAFSSTTTAFAKQKLRNGDTEFYFDDSDNWGELDGLNFTVDGNPARHQADASHPDIVYLTLPEPLAPGGTITIRTPFRVDVPNSYSRLGHVGESYQVTQWYPKPAVYDTDGWHAMPYLDQGEFYSEFGSFKVAITLPENYVVGATGILEEASEREWLLEKAATNRKNLVTRAVTVGTGEEPFPASSASTKTITFTAERVHDFAWFADKRFKVLHDTLQLAGAPEPINVWSMYTETEAALWARSTEYLKRAVRFYSDKVGTYPYPQVTGVQSALSAGGGMEYPMITVIGLSYSARSLDEVLTHEVGHNWFYGILGSNERDSPWMDEGLNSYYEGRYMDTYYEKEQTNVPFIGSLDLGRTGYRYLARQGRDQAPNTNADSLSQWNYWIQAYSKPAMALSELEAFVGADKVDAAMRKYYRQWRFKHPQPDDFFRVMEAELGSEISPWLADAMLTTKTSDWKVNSVRNGQINLAHSGDRPAPATAQIELGDGTKLARTQVPGEIPEKQADGGEGTKATLPEAANPLDLYAHNNASGTRKPVFRFGIGTGDAEKLPLFALPLLGYNIHDGFQAGVALHNRTLLPQPFEWMIAPLYGFSSGEVNGFGGARYRLLRPFSGVRQVMLSAGTQRWSDFTLARTDEAYGYARTAAKVEFYFDNPPITERKTKAFIQGIYLNKNRPAFARIDTVTQIVGTRDEANLFIRLGFESRTEREINPFAYALTLEYKNRDDGQSEAFEASHLRLDGTVEGAFQYEAGNFFRYRVFCAYFIQNELRDRAFYPESALSLVDNADSDYRRDGLYLGRNVNPDQNDWADQQLGRRQGGFRAPISSQFPAFKSNNYMVATNLDVDLPFGKLPIPLGVFLDAGYYGFRALSSDPATGRFSWVGGASLTLLDNRVGVFLPLVADPDTRNLLDQRGGLLSGLSVRLQLDGWLPWKWVDGIL
ncbi:M1 family metallopeptidase [Neolewinella antarctica]|uniref:Peptidase M1 membrane alanine aminopeptidase domain-containing protein n=1 Tax=Neolewinella antarctica TaxID=442734 RepID=A0ABX0XFX8_9BACT|nr:M1 family metallopeptidase [Neolewinella antarctica]NJC27786.1 hypothetical protein [Neolewinella antarctica]